MKKFTTITNEEITAYQKKDFDEEFMKSVEYAKDIWKERCIDYIYHHGDVGSCVVGAGIAVYYLPPRRRNYIQALIISSSQVTSAQASCVWEYGVDRVLEYLKYCGIEAHYKWGRMD